MSGTADKLREALAQIRHTHYKAIKEIGTGLDDLLDRIERDLEDAIELATEEEKDG